LLQASSQPNKIKTSDDGSLAASKRTFILRLSC